MIKVYDLWNRVNDYGKKFQSGNVTVSDFNGKVNESQDELLTKLSPFFETNDRVKNLLDPLIEPLNGETDLHGKFTKPEDFYKIASLEVKGNACFPAQMNEIAIYKKIPQRAPSLEKGNVYFITAGNNFIIYPKEVLSYSGFYIKYPGRAELVFSYTENIEAKEYVATVDKTNTKNLDWDQGAFNLILFMILVKYGISNREKLVQEFAMLGLQGELLASTINVQQP